MVTSMVTKMDQAAANSAHSRINIALNLENWKHLKPEVQEELLWFHQHLLDRKLSWKEASAALGYDASTVFKVLKGTYEGSWPNVCAAIASYRRLDTERGGIQSAEYVENSLYDLVAGGLEYAVANSSITTITSESRMGKTAGALHWRDLNNHGRSVYVIVPALSGTKMFLRRIAQAVGVNKDQAIPQIYEAVVRSFNCNRILIIDEAHRLIPGDRRSGVERLELVRDLHDVTRCAVALLATHRFDDRLRESQYMYEQILGRIGMPVRLPSVIREADYRPIVEQYVRRPSAELLAECHRIANSLGRLGILVETLKFASRIAHRAHAPCAEEHFFKAVKIRHQMMGDHRIAKGDAARL